MRLFDFNTSNLLQAFQALPPELLWLLLLLTGYACLLTLWKVFGTVGLQVYVVVAVIAANIQVLKAVPFSLFEYPVALGTILFASTYTATDILAECRGPRIARQTVFLGFAGFLLMTLVMILTLGFRPVDPATAGADWAWAAANHTHLTAIFTPAPALFLAGMVSYLVSQMNDIWLFSLLRKRTEGKFLWLRNNLSTAVSALIDNTLFSILAWIILAEDPLPWSVVVFTYILGTYGLRLGVALLDTPILYLARQIAPQETDSRERTNDKVIAANANVPQTQDSDPEGKR